LVHVAITMGDPAGVGHGIILKAAERLRPRLEGGDLALTVIGCGASHRATAAALGLPDRAVAAGSPPPWPTLAFLEAGPARAPIVPGVIAAEAGRLAYNAIAIAVRLTLADAICTAPLSKESLNLAGHDFAGHTELLAALTGAPDSVMMLAHGNMRVSHVSTHAALADVPRRLTPQRLPRVVELTAGAPRDFGIPQPRIVAAALNPHAGEGVVRVRGYRRVRTHHPGAACRRLRHHWPGAGRYRVSQAA